MMTAKKLVQRVDLKLHLICDALLRDLRNHLKNVLIWRGVSPSSTRRFSII